MQSSRLAAPFFLALAAWAGCSTSGGASAVQITNRAQLVGGERALGEVGDYLIENEKVRLVVQRQGFSRGFGVYGGSLIDADLRRPAETGTSGAGSGNDQFGELFPMIFVQAVDVQSVFVSADGKDGGPARITCVGEAGDFLELAAILNRAVTGSNVDFQSLTSGPQLRYTITYELEPGATWVNVSLEVTNISPRALRFPSELATQLLGLVNLPVQDFTVPIGDIALYGATSHVWLPGVGFDQRFGLQDAYRKKVDFPAFPGLVVEWVASRGEGASYGIAAAASPRNFVLGKKAIYDDARSPVNDTSILVPFTANGFLGMYYDSAPAELRANESFATKKHFIVGSGDVGSVLDGVLRLRRAPSGRIGGQVLDVGTNVPAEGASVVVYQRPERGGPRRVFAQYDVRANGSFGGNIPPGSYSARVTGSGRPLSPLVDFFVVEGQSTPLRLESTPPGRVVVRVVDAEGHPLPAKASAIGTYGPEHVGKLTRNFLFDLEAGEPFRSSDLVDDDPADERTRQYVEAQAFTDRGTAELLLRPGTYRIVTSRGPEWDLAATTVTALPSETSSVTHVLRRVVDTTGWIAGDLHIHSRQSIDSGMSLDERVRSLAAEGVEWAVATDHNFVTDYRPYVARNELFDWLFPMVGLEMTTLESGHFNGYPLRYDPGPVTHGSFEWARRTPDQIFDDLRARGSLGPERTIVQVNHARDGVLGYFSQYQRDPFTGQELPPTLVQQVIAPKGPAFRTRDGTSAFSQKFDAMEVAGSKLLWQIHHFRVPDALPSGELPANVPPAGTILRKENGQPAFPGLVDDWFTLLNLGSRTIAVGTGDSHSGGDEAGHFRTMVFVGDDRPITLSESRLVDAMQSRRVVATNAPLVDFWVDDPVRGVMGSTIQAKDPARVTLGYRLTSAPWASVARLVVWRNGTIAAVVPVDPRRDLAKDPLAGALDMELAKDAAGAPVDSWFVIEAIGYESLFPVVKPLEVPPVLLTDAVAVLAGPLGLGSDEFGALRPPEVFPITAWALTNPVWVTRGAGPFTPPGLVPVEVQARPENDPKFQAFRYPKSTIESMQVRRLAAASSTRDRFEPRGKVPLFYPRADNPLDVRKAISRFGHLGGHGD